MVCGKPSIGYIRDRNGQRNLCDPHYWQAWRAPIGSEPAPKLSMQMELPVDQPEGVTKGAHEMNTSLLSNAGHASTLHCKLCTNQIRNAFQNELICFDCWSARKLSQPERHNHEVLPPKSKPGGME